MKPFNLKYVILFLVFILPVITCTAQWSFGGRAGVNMCKLVGQMDEYSDGEYIYWLATPTGFALLNYQFNRTLSLSGELGYTTIGEERIGLYNEFIPYSQNYTMKVHYNCAQTGTVLKVTIDCKWFDSYFLAGPFFMRIYGGRVVYDDGHTKRVYDYKWMNSDYRLYMEDSLFIHYRNRTYNFGLYGGAGFEKKIRPGIVGVDFRFGITLMDMIAFEKDSMREKMKDHGYEPFRNLNFSITLSYCYIPARK